MHAPALLDCVRLMRAIPTLWLSCGEVGVVRSVWLSSPEFYEVEFHKPGDRFPVRALVRAQDLEVIEAAPLAGART